MRTSDHNGITWPVAIPILIGVAVIYVLRLDRIVGLMGDDGWYTLLGKALAEGQGYRLISSAAAPILPMYPPGFPAALAVAFVLDAGFPDNVWLLKSVSVIALAALGVLTFRYLVDHRRVGRDLAVCIAVGTALTPAFVFLATSTVMSECLFAAAQMLALLLIERSVDAESERRRKGFVVAAAAAVALVFMTRTAGLALLIAAPVYVVMTRGWRLTLIYTGALLACLSPWLMYAYLHQPTSEERAAQGGQIARPYADHFWRRMDGSGPVGAGDLPARVAGNLWNVVSRDIGGIVVPQIYRGPAESGQEVLDLAPPAAGGARSMGNTTGTVVVSCVVALAAFAGFIRTVRKRVTVAELLVPVSLAITAVWPFPTFRFVLPLAPLLFFYVMQSVGGISPAIVTRMLFLSIVGLQLFDHAGYIAAARGLTGGPVYIQEQFDEVDGMLRWMQVNLHADGAVATDRPALVYLHTGRKTLAIDRATDNWERWKANGVRYVVALTPGELPDSSHQYRVLFRSPTGRWIVEM